MLVTLSSTVVLSLLIGPTGTALGVIIGFLADSMFMYTITHHYLFTPLRQLWPVHKVLALALAYGAGFIVAHEIYAALADSPVSRSR